MRVAEGPADASGDTPESESPSSAPNAAEAEAQPRTYPVPETPSPAVESNHRVTGHAQYRNWCRHCLKIRARCDKHPAHNPRSHEWARIWIDYGYLSSTGDEDDERAEANGESPILFMRDDQGKGVFPILMEAKGVDHGNASGEIDLVRDHIVRLGYPRLTIKSDNERALLAFLRGVRRSLAVEGIQVSPESSCEHDPDSNGPGECGVGLGKGLIRTNRSDLEEKLGCRIPDDHAILDWLIQYSGAMQRRYTIGDDGKTPYERVHGRTCAQMMVEFG